MFLMQYILFLKSLISKRRHHLQYSFQNVVSGIECCSCFLYFLFSVFQIGYPLKLISFFTEKGKHEGKDTSMNLRDKE